MQKELNDIQIPIPSQLDDRVEEALGQVLRIHRGKVLRRVATPLATLVVMVGTVFTLAAVNPALASQIPLVGSWLDSLFYDANHDSKVGTNGAFLETYEVLEEVNVAAAAESGEWTVTFLQGYTDGNTVQLSLELTGPQEELATYTGVDVGNYGQGAVTATINGEAAAVEGVNPFYEREGQWVSTMTLAVPQSQQDCHQPGHPGQLFCQFHPHRGPGAQLLLCGGRRGQRGQGAGSVRHACPDGDHRGKALLGLAGQHCGNRSPHPGRGLFGAARRHPAVDGP